MLFAFSLLSLFEWIVKKSERAIHSFKEWFSLLRVGVGEIFFHLAFPLSWPLTKERKLFSLFLFFVKEEIAQKNESLFRYQKTSSSNEKTTKERIPNPDYFVSTLFLSHKIAAVTLFLVHHHPLHPLPLPKKLSNFFCSTEKFLLNANIWRFLLYTKLIYVFFFFWNSTYRNFLRRNYENTV